MHDLLISPINLDSNTAEASEFTPLQAIHGFGEKHTTKLSSSNILTNLNEHENAQSETLCSEGG